MGIRLIKMARRHWPCLIISALALIGASVMNLVTPEVVRHLTAALTAESGIDSALLLKLCILLTAAYLLRAGFRFVAMSISHLAAWRFVADLTFQVYDKLQCLSMRYYQDKQTGQLLSRTVNDARQAEVLIAHALPDLISSLIIVIGVMIMLLRINVKLALITLIPVPLIVYAGTFFSKKVSPLFRINQQVLGDINGVLQDNLSGMKEIQAFGSEKYEMNRLDAYRKRYAEVNIRANFANGIFHPGIEFLTSMGTVAVVGIGGILASGGSMNVSDIVGFLMYLSLFYTPLTTLARLVEDVQTTYAGATRVFEILDAESDVKEAENAAPLGRTSGSIAFKNVSFSYTENRPVLNDVSFDIGSGKMLALVGPTGVGKTTIISLLERFYDPDSGTITIDGTDIKGVTLGSLRDNISLVLQDVFLFNGTVHDNIAYGKKGATREEVIAAAKIAHANEFIVNMPDGYDTFVGERGMHLSGGQKQRIAIARAVLRDTPILILDEATSAVDTQTENEIQQAINGLIGKRTMIVIAHRLSTVVHADKILVLEKGRIVEEGTHTELLKNNGLYAKLCSMQFTDDDMPLQAESNAITL